MKKVILALCYTIGLISCNKGDNPGNSEDYLLLRWAKILVVDAKGNNLIGPNERYVKTEIRSRQVIPAIDTNWSAPDWLETVNGPMIKWNYFFQMVPGEETYKKLFFDHEAHFSFKNDIDTLRVEKHSMNEVNIYWNDQLKVTLMPNDTAMKEIRIIK